MEVQATMRDRVSHTRAALLSLFGLFSGLAARALFWSLVMGAPAAIWARHEFVAVRGCVVFGSSTSAVTALVLLLVGMFADDESNSYRSYGWPSVGARRTRVFVGDSAWPIVSRTSPLSLTVVVDRNVDQWIEGNCGSLAGAVRTFLLHHELSHWSSPWEILIRVPAVVDRGSDVLARWLRRISRVDMPHSFMQSMPKDSGSKQGRAIAAFAVFLRPIFFVPLHIVVQIAVRLTLLSLLLPAMVGVSPIKLLPLLRRLEVEHDLVAFDAVAGRIAGRDAEFLELIARLLGEVCRGGDFTHDEGHPLPSYRMACLRSRRDEIFNDLAMERTANWHNEEHQATKHHWLDHAEVKLESLLEAYHSYTFSWWHLIVACHAVLIVAGAAQGSLNLAFVLTTFAFSLGLVWNIYIVYKLMLESGKEDAGYLLNVELTEERTESVRGLPLAVDEIEGGGLLRVRCDGHHRVCSNSPYRWRVSHGVLCSRHARLRLVGDQASGMLMSWTELVCFILLSIDIPLLIFALFGAVTTPGSRVEYLTNAAIALCHLVFVFVSAWKLRIMDFTASGEGQYSVGRSLGGYVVAVASMWIYVPLRYFDARPLISAAQYLSLLFFAFCCVIVGTAWVMLWASHRKFN